MTRDSISHPEPDLYCSGVSLVLEAMEPSPEPVVEPVAEELEPEPEAVVMAKAAVEAKQTEKASLHEHLHMIMLSSERKKEEKLQELMKRMSTTK